MEHLFVLSFCRSGRRLLILACGSWGGVPAVDILNLSMNEGKSPTQDLSLAFVGQCCIVHNPA